MRRMVMQRAVNPPGSFPNCRFESGSHSHFFFNHFRLASDESLDLISLNDKLPYTGLVPTNKGTVGSIPTMRNRCGLSNACLAERLCSRLLICVTWVQLPQQVPVSNAPISQPEDQTLLTSISRGSSELEYHFKH